MMLDQTEENEPVIFQENSGKIHCPKCRSKIGAFAWSGERCNCGAFVAPSFHIQKAKLDAFTVRGANSKQEGEKCVLFFGERARSRSLAHEVKLVIATM